MANTFTSALDTSKPAGTRSKLLGDDDIREFKVQYAERFNIDHQQPSSEAGDGNIGFHRKATLLDQVADPTAVTAAAILYGKTVSALTELHVRMENGNIRQLTSNGLLNGASFTNLANTPAAAGVMPAANLPAGTSLSQIYPIGCIYTTTVSTNPNTVFGFGTWTAFGAGKVLVGLNGSDTDFDTVEETGGSKTNAQFSTNAPSGGTFQPDGTSADSCSRDTHTHVVAAAAFSLVQPYIVVYFWKRTA